MFNRVLLCYDGSEEGRRALEEGAKLAIHMKAAVSVLVIVPTEVTDQINFAKAAGHIGEFGVEQNYLKLLNGSVGWLSDRGVTAAPFFAHGDPVEVIVDHAKRLKSDLIVVGVYPTSGARRWWSVQKQKSLADHACCSILIAIGSES